MFSASLDIVTKLYPVERPVLVFCTTTELTSREEQNSHWAEGKAAAGATKAAEKFAAEQDKRKTARRKLLAVAAAIEMKKELAAA